MTRLAAPFVVLTSPRSGSSWLMESLGSHPQVVTYGELFLETGGVPRYGHGDLPYFENYLASRRGRELHRVVYLRKVFRARPGVRATGFKLMYRQARRNPALLRYFAVRRVRAIHLIRANLLDAVISYEVAAVTGSFHAHRGDAVPQAVVSLDAAGLRERLGDMEWAIARGRLWLERFRLPRIDVAYEELLGRREETFERVLRFLEVEPEARELDSGMVRTGTGSPLERVENAAEVRAALVGTRFEWMLDGTRP